MNAAFSVVARRKRTWSRISEVSRRCSSATHLLRRRRRTQSSGSSSNRSSMSNNDTTVTAEAGHEGQNDQKSNVAVEGNGVAAGDNSQQKGGESETTADATHGFTRPEMHSAPLVGSVAYYERHVFLSWKGPESWPSNVEAAAAESDHLPNLLGAALKAHKNAMPKKTRLTICDGQDGSSDGDVLIFPDMVRYKGLSHVDVDAFVDDALVNGKEWKGSQVESLSGSYIFVCSHGSRDRRCGTCGPVLIEKLQEKIKLRGLEGEIFVRACSHVGGHKYAGNVIVFSSTGTGAVSGQWYGYVSPADVPLILDQQIGKGEIIDRLWRGEMGVSEEDQKMAKQNRLNKLEAERNTGGGSTDQVNGVKGCGATGCCQSSEPAVKENKQIPPFLQSYGSSVHDGHLIFLDDDESTDEEPMDPRIPLWGSYYIPLPKWVDSWEKEDTNAALAVLGAAAAVAFAIHIYRQS